MSQNDRDSLLYTIENYHLTLHQIFIDSSFTITKKLPQYEYFEVHLDKINYDLPDYILNINGVELNTNDSVLHIDSVQVIPRYSKHDFAYKTKKPGRVDCTWNDISLMGFDFDGIAFYKRCKADTMTLNGFTVYSYKNKNVPPTPEVKPLFQHILQTLPISVDIPFVKFENGNVFHEELAEHRIHAGKIMFAHIQGHIDGLTNIVKTKNQYLKVTADGSIMKTAKMNVVFSLPVDPKNEIFTLTGHVRRLQFAEFNEMLEPAAHLSIESGKSDRIDFSLIGNEKTATVNMLLLYEDLEVAVLTPDNKRKRWLLSELANDLILIRDNPHGKQAQRQVKSSADRNIYLYQFNFLWITMLEGIKESVGFTEKKQKTIHNLIHKKDDSHQNNPKPKNKTRK